MTFFVYNTVLYGCSCKYLLDEFSQFRTSSKTLLYHLYAKKIKQEVQIKIPLGLVFLYFKT